MVVFLVWLENTQELGRQFISGIALRTASYLSWLRHDSLLFKDSPATYNFLITVIYYSFTENAPPNTANGGFMIKADEYELFLSSSMMGFRRPEERVTAEAAAGRLWEDFLERAGITCD